MVHFLRTQTGFFPDPFFYFHLNYMWKMENKFYFEQLVPKFQRQHRFLGIWNAMNLH